MFIYSRDRDRKQRVNKQDHLCTHSLLHGIFPTEGLNLGPPVLWADSLLSEPPGKPLSLRCMKNITHGGTGRRGNLMKSDQ